MARNTSGLRRGGPGRKKGISNRVTPDVKVSCEALVTDPVYVERFRRAFVSRTLSHHLESMMAYLAYGKPRQTVDLGSRLSLC